MPSVIRPSDMQIVTKDGECHLTITLELNINLNTGNVDLSAQSNSNKITKEETSSIQELESGDDDKVKWVIPSFETERIEGFGNIEKD